MRRSQAPLASRTRSVTEATVALVRARVRVRVRGATRERSCLLVRRSRHREESYL